MKWLFAVLTALNIAVFASMLVQRNGVPQHTPEYTESGTYELPRPRALDESAPAAASDAIPDWIGLPDETAAAEAAAERRRKERLLRLAQEKKKREQQQNAEDAGFAAAENGSCTPSATITMNEDDYHRIKGLLGKWPHAASRSVTRRSADTVKPNKPTRFKILLSSEGDAAARIEALGQKGFDSSIYGNEIHAGSTRSRQAAQRLAAKLSAAGFSGVHILEETTGHPQNDTALSIARMSLVLSVADRHSFQELQEIVGRYGKLKMQGCR